MSDIEEDIRTRMKRQGDNDNTRITDDAESRKLAAQKKARELEQRLAKIARKKKQDALDQKKSDTPTALDKTRIKESQEVALRTRVAKKNRSLNVDKTQIQKPPSAVDKTQFKPARPLRHGTNNNDKTQLSDLLISKPVSTGHVPIDPAQHMEAGQELIKGRFVFERVLGAGGMGVVYKAKDLLKVEAQDSEPYVAIKVLSDEFKTHPEAFIALQRESRKTQRIAHPNIVNVHDFDRDGETVFMTMEYLEGRPLDKTISQYKSTGLPEEDVWKILEGICAALTYAHEQKIIHSDFKPGNIFVTDQGTAKVFDFGIARAVAKAEQFEDQGDDKTVFDAGNLGALTPAYASLEMLEGKSPDIRDDIYALGCIAYEMFTGNHPFNRVHADEACRKKLKARRIPGISKRQWRVIESALSFKREDRIATVNEFWAQLISKRGSGLIVGAAGAVLMVVISVLAYQNYYAPLKDQVSEDEMRSKIEKQIMLDRHKSDLEELIAEKAFSRAWERDLYKTYGALLKFMPASNPWLAQRRHSIRELYLEYLASLIDQHEFIAAKDTLKGAAYFGLPESLNAQWLSRIDQAENEFKLRQAEEQQARKAAQAQQQSRQRQAEQKKKINTAFNTALATVEKQLQCRSTMNMGDIDIAVNKLRSLDIARYRKLESKLIQQLGFCIEKIGQSFPERGEEFKKRSLRTFTDSKLLSAIKIEPKDPCDSALAGLGARGERATCRDTLKNGGNVLGKSPSMVVVPAKGSVPAFAISKYEVSVADMNKFCENSSHCDVNTEANERLPATNVDVAVIQKYLSWLSAHSKRKYRLPTRFEWIYAARANSAVKDNNSNCTLDSRGIKKGGVLINASSGQQNRWGLVNVLGNAQELVRADTGYLAMGGSYDTPMRECTVEKSQAHQGRSDKYTGFRILRAIDS